MGRFLYMIARGVFRIYFRLFKRMEVIGEENRPDTGSLIIMANHVSNLDPPVVGGIMDRRVHFMAKEELFKNPIAAWAFNQIGTFPVKRGRPDRKALRNAFNVLKNEKVLGIFPEGTRHKQGKPGRAKSGAVMIPIKTKTPILPVGIKYLDKNILKVSIGKPFELEDYYDKKLSREELKEAGEIIMDKISSEISRL